MAQRIVLIGFALAGLATLAFRPLIGFVLLVGALALYLDGRGALGRGTWRAMIAFITSLWVTLAGVIATLLGMLVLPGTCDPTTTTCEDGTGNFLFAPGLLLLALGLTLLVWSIAESLRLRRTARSVT